MADTTQPGSLGGLKPGEDPYTITNDDPRVPDTVALLQSWGAPQNVAYDQQPGSPNPIYSTKFIRDGYTQDQAESPTGSDNPNIYRATSGMMVQNPNAAYKELSTRGMINIGTATSGPSYYYDGRPAEQQPK